VKPFKDHGSWLVYGSKIVNSKFVDNLAKNLVIPDLIALNPRGTTPSL
jgi:hypothetical protein